MPRNRFFRLFAGSAMASLALTGCTSSSKPELPSASFVAMQEGPGGEFIIPESMF
jgi:polysaccharide export outer membrane protein